MNAQEVVKKILERQGKSQRALAKELGIPPQTLHNRLNKPRGIGIGDYVAMLDALGYELKVVPAPVKDERPDFTVGRDPND